VYKVLVQSSGGQWINWHERKYKTLKSAEQAARQIKLRFKQPWWTAFYRNTPPKIEEIKHLQ